MQHSAVIQREIRDLPPEDGWRVVEKTGRASVTCSCGLDTGWIPKTDATAQARTHGK